MMHWIWTILIGFVAGLIAKWVTPGAGPSGFWLTAILGIAGALIATFVGQMMGFYAEGQPAGFISHTDDPGRIVSGLATLRASSPPPPLASR